MVAVAYRRWSFTRDFYCKSLTGEVLVFWIVGRFWKVVAHGGSTVENVTTRETFSKPVYTIWRFVYIFALYLRLSPRGLHMKKLGMLVGNFGSSPWAWCYLFQYSFSCNSKWNLGCYKCRRFCSEPLTSRRQPFIRKKNRILSKSSFLNRFSAI